MDLFSISLSWLSNSLLVAFIYSCEDTGCLLALAVTVVLL